MATNDSNTMLSLVDEAQAIPDKCVGQWIGALRQYFSYPR
jgi:hypothetical protein